MDLNYLFDDGSVGRFDAVDHHLAPWGTAKEDRMVAVPNYIEDASNTGFYQMLPRTH
jgi:hypothetical protein